MKHGEENNKRKRKQLSGRNKKEKKEQNQHIMKTERSKQWNKSRMRRNENTMIPEDVSFKASRLLTWLICTNNLTELLHPRAGLQHESSLTLHSNHLPY
jgi:hypothetical protein